MTSKTKLSLLAALVAALAWPAGARAAFPQFPAASSGGGAVSSVSAGSGCVTVSPTTGAVVVTSSGCLAVSGTGIVKVVSGVAALATKNIDYVAPGWLNQQFALAQSVVPTLTTVAWSTECSNITVDWTVGSATGSGTFVVLAASDGGVCQVTSGATANSFRVGTNPNGAPLISNVKAVPWGECGRVAVTTTIDANVRAEVVGISSGADIGWHLYGATSTVDWTALVRGAGNTAADTGQAIDVGNTYHTLCQFFDGSAHDYMYYDGVLKYTITDLSNFDTGAADARAFSINGATAANREFHIDKLVVFAGDPLQ